MSFSETRRDRVDATITGVSARLAQNRRMLAMKSGIARSVETQSQGELPIDGKLETLKQSVVTVCTNVRWERPGFFHADGSKADTYITSTVGTGSFIDSTHILTNKHVIERAFAEDSSKFQLSVVIPGQEDAVLVKSFVQIPLLDVVILELAKPSDRASIELGDSSSVKVGDALTAIGSPGSLERAGTVSRANVTRLADGSLPLKYKNGDLSTSDKTEYIETENGLIRPGNSGGPIFDADGKVVGIAVGGREEEDVDGNQRLVGRVIPINHIKTFVENHTVYAEVKTILDTLDIERDAQRIPDFRAQFKKAFRMVKTLLKTRKISEEKQKLIMSDRWMHWTFASYIERAEKVKAASKQRKHTKIVEQLHAEYLRVFGVPLERFDVEKKTESAA